jgi:hypothetical protein
MTPCASEQHLLEIALFSLECFNDINAATRRMMLALGYSEPAEGEPVPLTNDPYGDWNRSSARAEVRRLERCIESAERLGANPFLYRERLARFDGTNGVQIKIHEQHTVYGAI